MSSKETEKLKAEINRLQEREAKWWDLVMGMRRWKLYAITSLESLSVDKDDPARPTTIVPHEFAARALRKLAQVHDVSVSRFERDLGCEPTALKEAPVKQSQLPVKTAVIAQPLLRTQQVAEILGVAQRTVEFWRLTGKGPRYRRLGRQTIRYTLEDVNAFIQSTGKDFTTQD